MITEAICSLRPSGGGLGWEVAVLIIADEIKL